LDDGACPTSSEPSCASACSPPPQQRVNDVRTRVTGPTNRHPYPDQPARLSATGQRLLRHLAHAAILPQAGPVAIVPRDNGRLEQESDAASGRG